MIELRNFPIPPSANQLYVVRGLRRVKSGLYRAFERRVEAWKLENIYVRTGMDLPAGYGYHIDCEFYFLKEKILTKDGRPKKIDCSNFLKASHDAIAQIIGVDDLWFFSGTFRKCMSQKATEYMDIKIYANEYNWLKLKSDRFLSPGRASLESSNSSCVTLPDCNRSDGA